MSDAINAFSQQFVADLFICFALQALCLFRRKPEVGKDITAGRRDVADDFFRHMSLTGQAALLDKKLYEYRDIDDDDYPCGESRV